MNGKLIAANIRREIKEEVERLEIKPKFVVIQVGDNVASTVYIAGKRKACLEVGIDFEHLKFSSKIKEEELIEEIEELNKNKDVHAILVQLPLPDHINTKVVNHINPSKDADGMTSDNLGKLMINENALTSCTPKGIIRLLEEYMVEMKSKNVVIVGRSNLVGKPLINLFLNEDATVTCCHSKTSDLEEFTKKADILVVAAGKKHLIKENMVKKGVVVVDVGINKEEGKLYGDVDFYDVYEKCSLITPVPGGVGPMTVAMLLSNVLSCYNKNV